MKRLTAAYAYAALLLVLASVGAHAQHGRDVADKTIPSVVLIVTEDAHGEELALGSGFIVKDGVVVTNAHVMEGAARGYVKLGDQKTRLNIEGYVGRDPVHDLMLLSVKDVTAPALSLGDSGALKTGDTVYAVGNPRGLEGTFSQGIVSSVRKIDTDTLLQITAPISPGSSGGPVLREDGAVVGVSVATFRGGQNLNFAIPSEYVKALLAKQTPVQAFSERQDNTKVKSYLEGLGSRSSAGVAGRALRWRNAYLSGGDFSFTLQNLLREPVKNVRCIVVFYDRSNQPVDFQVVTYDDTIPGGLGKRVEGKAGQGVFDLTTRDYLSDKPSTKIEFRILDFDIISD